MAARPPIHRRGISLLEVLISMFILLFGLLGVASMFPVGQLYVTQSGVYDRASAVGQAAFHDIQTRGLLNPNFWQSNAASGTGSTNLPVQFDPVAGGLNPSTGAAPIHISGLNPVTVAGLTNKDSIEYVFGSRDDLVVEFPIDDDSPALQPASTMTREHNGHFSWMFTVTGATANPMAINEYLVSVAVFDRRVRGSEGSFSATLSGGLGGGQIAIPGTEAQLEALKTGDWVHLSIGSNHRWYRIVNITPWDAGRTLTVAGGDWNTTASTGTVTIFDRVVAVYEKVMPRAE